MIRINHRIIIPPEEINYRISRASGSGGQKVNKTNSRVELTWDFQTNTTISQNEKDRIQRKLSTQISKENLLIVSSEKHRTQLLNKEDCTIKLCEMIRNALYEQKKRVATKPSKGQKAKRTDRKRQNGDKKKNRKKVTDY